MTNIEMAKKNKALLIDFLLKDGTLSKNAIAGLLGTIQDECGFIPSMENLNYTTTARLREIWPDKFKGMTDSAMAKYIRNPKELADHVYKERGGFAYLGRGFIQLTGKANYDNYGKKLGIDFSKNPGQAMLPEIAARVALLYTKERAVPFAKKKYGKDLNALNIDEATTVITMAVQGEGKDYTQPHLKKDIAERISYAKLILKELGDEAPVVSTPAPVIKGGNTMSKKKVALVVGHSYKDPGAVNTDRTNGLLTKEYDYNDAVVKAIIEVLKLSTVVEPILVKRDDTPYSELPNKVNALNPLLIIEFHCNAVADPKAGGTETLYSGSAKSKPIAAMLQTAMLNVFKLSDRGLKVLDSSDRGSNLILKTKAPCFIVEPFFISNEKEETIANTNKTTYAKTMAKTIEEIAVKGLI